MKKNPSILLALAVLGFSATAASAATIVSLNPTADTYLRAGSADQAFGASTEILFGNHASVGPFTGLLRFNIPTPVGLDTIVESVTLTLTSTSNGAGSSVTLTVFQLAAANADWVEGTGTGGNAVASSSWNNKISTVGVEGATTTPWAGSVGARTAGTDYVNTSLASFTGNASTIGTGNLAFTSTGAFASTVQNSAGGSLNLWVGTPSGAAVTEFFRIASRETAGTASDPQLTITYIPESSSAMSLLAGVGMLALRRRRVATRA